MAKTEKTKKTKEQIQKEVDEVSKKLETGVKEVYTSGRYAQYLKFMSKFHNYSINNSLLIYLQNPEASLVAGYRAWQQKFKRQVRKGEKGISIFAPVIHTYRVEDIDENGEIVEVTRNYNTYRVTKVFDVSQTDGEDLPEICNELTGEVKDYQDLMDKIVKFSPAPVSWDTIMGGANGCYYPELNKIIIKEGMSQQQTIKTLIHEIAHAILHNKKAEKEDEEVANASRQMKEVQAESIAYIVCSSLGLNTSDYSFGYVAGWADDKEAKDLIDSMEVIKKTAGKIYEGITAAAV